MLFEIQFLVHLEVVMTMADISDPIDPIPISSGQQLHQQQHQENINFLLNGQTDPKKRKRKRLLAVLDKLHHQTNSTSNFNNNSQHENSLSANNNNLITNDLNLSANKVLLDEATTKYMMSTNLRSVEFNNAEFLKNLIALTQRNPYTLPLNGLVECNNNNNNVNENLNLSLNSKKCKLKVEIKEEPPNHYVEQQSPTIHANQEFYYQPKNENLINDTNTDDNRVLDYSTNKLKQPQHNHARQNQNVFFPVEPQDAPLDLSMKTLQHRTFHRNQQFNGNMSLNRKVFIKAEQQYNALQQMQMHLQRAQTPKECITVQTNHHHLSNHQNPESSLPQYYDIKVSPIVEEVAPGSDVAYVCPICGQMFSLNDR